MTGAGSSTVLSGWLATGASASRPALELLTAVAQFVTTISRHALNGDETAAAEPAKRRLDFRLMPCRCSDIRRCWSFADTRHDYGEERLIGFGPLDGQLCVVVHVERSRGLIRIVSFPQGHPAGTPFSMNSTSRLNPVVDHRRQSPRRIRQGRSATGGSASRPSR